VWTSKSSFRIVDAAAATLLAASTAARQQLTAATGSSGPPKQFVVVQATKWSEQPAEKLQPFPCHCSVTALCKEEGTVEEDTGAPEEEEVEQVFGFIC